MAEKHEGGKTKPTDFYLYLRVFLMSFSCIMKYVAVNQISFCNLHFCQVTACNLNVAIQRSCLCMQGRQFSHQVCNVTSVILMLKYKDFLLILTLT